MSNDIYFKFKKQNYIFNENKGCKTKISFLWV